MGDQRPEILEPWDRRAEESDQAFEAFALYRDSGTGRSIRQVAEALDKSRQLIGQWSSKHDWVDRAASWDLEQDRHRREAMRLENVQAGQRHARQAQGALQAMTAPITELLRRLTTEDGQAKLKTMDLGELLEISVKASRVIPRLVVAERLARGMSTENVAFEGNLTVHHERAAAMDDKALDDFLLGKLTPAALPPAPDGS